MEPEQGSRGEGVVLLHGIARTSASMRLMQRTAEAAGFATLNLDYPSRKQCLQDLAEAIHPPIEAFADGRTGSVHFLTHSMGGLLTRVYLARHRPARLGRVVMLAPPNRGSEMADLLSDSYPYRTFYGPAGKQLVTAQGEALLADLGTVDYTLGVIAGDWTIDPISWLLIPGANDGKVAVDRTRIEGVSDHIVLHTSHTTMLLNVKVAEQAVAFLKTGRFRRA
jgi:triacylglycerol esterase/lipase EstA (alpha/beta hydrolase family)